jgi:tetratricopeptide (TPR) repeat protein
VDEAKEAFRWAVRYYNQADKLTPEELVYVSECAAEYARWIRNSKQFAFILNEVIKDATKQDPDYWPAEQFAGMLLLEKYNRPDAIDAFDAVLKINPKAADPLVGKALAALVKFDLKDADAYAEQALKQNPKHVGALRVKAEIYLTAGDLPAAEKVLLEAKTVSPKDSATLGRLAGVYVLEKKTDEFEAVVKFVNSFDSKPGEFYHELGKVMEDRKQYAKAEEYYKKSYELRPVLSAPRTGLGMLYLRLGNEKEGRVLLDEAFKADPFNIRVSNSRKVLAHLDNYKTVETAHYILKYDEKTDALLGEWMADFLEETHAELKQQFQFEPEGKFVIEIFNSHEMFSGRTVGLPDLHTIGACTGRVVAMASPKAKGLAKPFNWGRVMRHELTHIFNLAQTDYQCPHWITEGLAVVNEKMSRPPMWSQILRDRYESKTLLNLDTIMMGFVRPKGPDEWTLAYCQSQLYVEFMVQTYGTESVGKILTEFKKSSSTASAIKNACGVDQATFEKGYQEYVAKVVKGLSAPTSKGKEEKPKTVEELIETVKKDPKDDDSAAKLAEAYLRRGKVADAKKLAEGILERDPNHAGGCVVKAKLLARAGDEEEANAMLQKALKAKPDDPKLLSAVGKLLVEQKKYEEAAKLLEKGRSVAPLDGDWLEQLARIYKETKDNDKLIPILSTMVSLDPDDLTARTTLAKLCLDAKKYAEAEQHARDALMIDVANLPAKDVLIEALNQRGKKAEADKIKKRYEKVTAVDE